VAEKMGFKEEGIFKSIVYIDGEYVDSLCLSLLKKEWREENK